MLTELATEFLSKKMMINVSSLYEKLNKVRKSEYKCACFNSIEEYTKIILNNHQKIEKPIDKFSNRAVMKIEKTYCDSYYQLQYDSEEDILGTIQHAFSNYAAGGLEQLYTGQQNEDWYPEINLTQVLFPNNIDILPEEVTVYRGCSASDEIKQAWTTDINIAMKFAYSHYESQPWYNEKERCILEAKINRDDIFYYSESNNEKEVVVNPRKLKNVTMINKNKKN